MKSTPVTGSQKPDLNGVDHAHDDLTISASHKIIILVPRSILSCAMLFETHEKFSPELTNQRLPPYIETEGRPIVQMGQIINSR